MPSLEKRGGPTLERVINGFYRDEWEAMPQTIVDRIQYIRNASLPVNAPDRPEVTLRLTIGQSQPGPLSRG